MLVAVGYAETRPEYPNKDETGVPIVENRKKNRRVVIKVVAPGVVQQPTGSNVAVPSRKTVLTGDGTPDTKAAPTKASAPVMPPPPPPPRATQ